MADEDPSDEATDVLQHLIRNACVNDGSVESGHEARTVDVLAQVLGTSGLDVQTFEPQPGRGSLVARIEGSDPAAPTLLLMGHTDVVPVNADRWRRDPFGGEVVDTDDGVAEVWGRGAVDMLNLTAIDGRRDAATRRPRASDRRARSSTSPSPTKKRSAPTAPTTWSPTSATRCRPTT